MSSGIDENGAGIPSWVERVGWITAAAAVAAIAASLAATLVLRLRGGSWAELSDVGDFWGGHLSGVALIFLAGGLIVQSHTSRAQARETRKHMQVLEYQIGLQRMHFLVGELRRAASELEFTTVSFSTADAKTRGVKTKKGIEDLRLALCDRISAGQPEESETVSELFVSLPALSAYLRLCDVARQEASKDALRDGGAILAIVEGLSPPAVRAYAAALVAERDASLADLERMSAGGLSESTGVRIRARLAVGCHSLDYSHLGAVHSVVLSCGDRETLIFGSVDEKSPEAADIDHAACVALDNFHQALRLHEDRYGALLR